MGPKLRCAKKFGQEMRKWPESQEDITGTQVLGT